MGGTLSGSQVRCSAKKLKHGRKKDKKQKNPKYDRICPDTGTGIKDGILATDLVG